MFSQRVSSGIAKKQVTNTPICLYTSFALSNTFLQTVNDIVVAKGSKYPGGSSSKVLAVTAIDD